MDAHLEKTKEVFWYMYICNGSEALQHYFQLLGPFYYRYVCISSEVQVKLLKGI